MIQIQSLNISPSKDHHDDNLYDRQMKPSNKYIERLKENIRNKKHLHDIPKSLTKGTSLENTLELPRLEYHRQLFKHNRQSSKSFINQSKQKSLKKQNQLLMMKIASQHDRTLQIEKPYISSTKKQLSRLKRQKQNKRIEKENKNLCERLNKQYSEYSISKNLLKSQSKQSLHDGHRGVKLEPIINGFKKGKEEKEEHL